MITAVVEHESREQFFFEKKNQKTFVCCGQHRFSPLNSPPEATVKSFLFLFSKKNYFLSGLSVSLNGEAASRPTRRAGRLEETAMPKIEMAAVPERRGVGYPEPFAAQSAHRRRRKLGEAGGLCDFGVNLTRLPPGAWSSQRHWHSHEDEFVFVLEGSVVLIEDDGETVLCAGEAAAFPKGNGNGHHMLNRSDRDAVYLEIGSRHPEDVTICSDIDMMSSSADGRFVHKDGTPFT